MSGQQTNIPDDMPIRSLSESLHSHLGEELRRRVSNNDDGDINGLKEILCTNKEVLIAREFNLNARHINKNLHGPFDIMQGLWDLRTGRKIPGFPRYPGSLWYLAEGELDRLCEALGITHEDLPRNSKMDRVLMVAGVSMIVIGQVRTIEEAYAFKP
ncbi:hypothetical protein CDD81_1413 [Ophiocordyceps australis]|uniref:Uncharacterized protein n=1 Tax=Ophiocordyceps australis TaxID=1399860 RepID=A0A2C5XZ06_9HYPO|nr:hypothetical protein CDD81_1413 [Ophiocordyceps australis]